MSISMYQLTVGHFVHTLNSLIVILEKGIAFAEVKKLDPSVLPNSRLAPDMFPLTRQVQIVSDNVKGCVARLAGIQPPVWEDNEKTLPELIARTRKTIDYVQSFKPGQIDGSEDKTIEVKFPGYEFTFTGINFYQLMTLPNLHFHVSTAYNILRHNGVELAKGDLLGKIQ